MEPVENENFETVLEKLIENEPLFTLFEGLSNIYRTALKATALASEKPTIIDKEKCYYSTRAKDQHHWCMMTLVKNQHFLTFPQKDNLDTVFLEIHNSAQFDALIKVFNQTFVSDLVYIFFGRSVYKQIHLGSLLNFMMNELKLANSQQGQSNKITEVLQIDLWLVTIYFYLRVLLKEYKHFLYVVLANIILCSCADIRRKNLLYIINILNNLGLSDKN